MVEKIYYFYLLFVLILSALFVWHASFPLCPFMPAQKQGGWFLQ